MKPKSLIILSFAILTSLFFSNSALATTITAASCNQSDVQAAIDQAQDGDTVLVPEGECVWEERIFLSGKAIKLQGSGIDVTVITASTSTPMQLVYNDLTASRITGFTFNNGWITTDGDGWRVDHCKFYSASTLIPGVAARGTRQGFHPTGLVDNCIFYNTRVLVMGSAAMLNEGPDQHILWSQPLNLGSGDNVVYVEDNTFTATVHANAVDTNYGGRYVFRYNIVNDSYIEAHSVQGTNRASRKWEIYNNQINQVNRGMWAPFFIRGGTGVIFNNKITGKWNGLAIIFDNVRSFSSAGEGGLCGGTSPWDGNEDSTGYPCRDQIGRSTDQWLWTSSNPYPPQELDPAYIWNNKYGENEVTVYVHNCFDGSTGEGSCAHIKKGRDYIEGIPKPGYTPYTYPHPFRTDCQNYPMLCDGDTTPPAPPKRLTVI